MAAPSISESVHLVHVTDTHLFASVKSTLLKMNTMRSFGRVIDSIRLNERNIDHVLATGDISQDGSLKSYTNFTEMIESLNAPFSWLPGNHDDASVMENIPTNCGAGEKQVKCNNWQLVMLDTTTPDQVHGFLSEQELVFLACALSAAEQNPAIDHCLICLHHNPIPADAEWMQDIGLRNSDDLFAVLSQSTLVRAMVYGHIHQDLDLIHENIRCFCTPSTCIQFKAQAKNFALDQNSPGYRNIQLYQDGRIESEVVRITADENLADLDSDGY